MLGEIKKLLKITGGGLKFLVLLILRSPVNLYMTVMQALFLQNAFNSIEQNDSRRLTAVCLTFLVASLGIFLYNGTVWSIYAPFVTHIESRLRIKLFKKILKFSHERIEALSRGEWLTRLNTDVQMPFSQPIHLPHAANAILQIVVSAIILWSMNKAVFILVMLFIIPHIIINQLLIAKSMQKLSKESLEATAENTDELNTLINCVDIALIYDGYNYLMDRYENKSLHLLKTKMKIHRKNALNAAILPLFGLGGYLTLLIVSRIWIADGNFSFGDLTAAFQYRGGVLTGVMMLINCLISIQASMAGIRRINETMSENNDEVL